MKKTYNLISLGCPKNLVDSEVFAFLIEQAGYQPTEDIEQAEIIIVNTCGFILDAKEEAVQTILEAAEYKKEGCCEKLIVTGCLVKRYATDLQNAIPEIDHLIALKDFPDFAGLFSTQLSIKRKILTPNHYAYLRISDGCDNHCSYCAIPAIRGKVISRSIAELMKEAQFLADSGVKELIITAQDTTQFGKDLDSSQNLVELLNQLHTIDSFEWFRLLYLHPAHLTDEMVDEFCKMPKLCHYFDIPLQHINDRLLKSMNRKVTKQRIIDLIQKIRTTIPDATLRTTFIVGYPDEGDDEFQELLEFIKEMRFERLGVFTYSREEDTPSYDFLPLIDENIAEQRKDEIMQEQQSISEQFLASLVGKTIPVLIDKQSDLDDYPLVGRTFFDAPEIDGNVYLVNQTAKIGSLVNVKIIDAWEYDLVGEIVGELNEN
jgi:ribosomal protein S12 methylthiotransferase